MWSQLSTTCSNVLKQRNGELQVAVNHNQLRIIASETVDPIDWSHHHPHGQYPLSASCIVYISATSVGFERATAACEATTFHMRPLRVILPLCQRVLWSYIVRIWIITVLRFIIIVIIKICMFRHQSH